MARRRWTVVIREEFDNTEGVLMDRTLSVEHRSKRGCKADRVHPNDFHSGEEFEATSLDALAYAVGDGVHELELVGIARAAFELGRRFERKYPGKDFKPDY